MRGNAIGKTFAGSSVFDTLYPRGHHQHAAVSSARRAVVCVHVHGGMCIHCGRVGCRCTCQYQVWMMCVRYI